MSFDEYEEKLLTAQNVEEKVVDTYFRWGRLVHAYRGYVEGGELHCVVEEQLDFSSEDLRALTPRRLELLYGLSDLRVESINDLAHKVRRDVKNVYNDLKVLKNLGFVRLVRKRDGKIVPEAVVEEVTFAFQ